MYHITYLYTPRSSSHSSSSSSSASLYSCARYTYIYIYIRVNLAGAHFFSGEALYSRAECKARARRRRLRRCESVLSLPRARASEQKADGDATKRGFFSGARYFRFSTRGERAIAVKTNLPPAALSLPSSLTRCTQSSLSLFPAVSARR